MSSVVSRVSICGAPRVKRFHLSPSSSREPEHWALDEVQQCLTRARLRCKHKSLPEGARCVCASDDWCSDCGAVTPGGTEGHVFWDELEMLRHGWCDAHGQHWGPAAAKDELQLLQTGKIDRMAHHAPYGACTPPVLEDIEMPTNKCVLFANAPTLVPVPEDEHNSFASSRSDTSVSMLHSGKQDALSALGEHKYCVDGGKLTVLNGENSKVTFLQTDGGWAYVQHSSEGTLLMRSYEKDGKWITQRLQCYIEESKCDFTALF